MLLFLCVLPPLLLCLFLTCGKTVCMKRAFSSITAAFKKQPTLYIFICVALVYVFSRQLSKLLSFLRSKLEGGIIGKSVKESVAHDRGNSADTIEQNVRIETCRCVADAC